MAITKIEWTQATWNPVTGCTKLSAGCAHCYAERLAHRLQAMGKPSYEKGFEVTYQEHALDLPLRWRKPRRIFVNSMGDLFHEEVHEEYIRRVFDVMNTASWHQFQVLTKRSERLRELGPNMDWSENIWAGVTVESADYLHRIDDLLRCEAHHRFLSLEPLLGSISNLPLEGIEWVIVGGESGPGARPMQREWVIETRDQCVASGVPFFFKQWGGVNIKKAGRLLDGRVWDEYPISL